MLEYSEAKTIKNTFKIENPRASKKGNIELVYWTLLNHRPLYTYEPFPLIELPEES